MGKDFVNVKLRKDLMLAGIWILVLLLTCILLLRNEQDKQKDLLTNIYGDLLVELNQEDSNMAMWLVTKLQNPSTTHRREEAREIFQSYGYNMDSVFEFEELLQQGQSRSIWLLTAVFFALFLSTLLYIFRIHHYFYGYIRKIIRKILKVIEGDYETPDERTLDEGDLSRLSYAITEMTQIIRQSVNDLNKEKEFLAQVLSDISHQLKTPLSALMIYQDIQEQGGVNEEQREKIRFQTGEQLSRMEWLIRSLLKLARLDAKAIVFEMKLQDLNKTLKQSINSLEVKLIEKKLEIQFSQGEPMLFLHDLQWMKEALINVINNAIEHSHLGGRIFIRLTNHLLYYSLEITDEGSGIDEEDLPHIFKRFYKSERNQNKQSVGIGLALTKAIIDAHGGSIAATNGEGGGASFNITLYKSKPERYS